MTVARIASPVSTAFLKKGKVPVAASIIRARALRAANLVWLGRQTSKDLLDALVTVATGPRPPRWATQAYERLGRSSDG